METIRCESYHLHAIFISWIANYANCLLYNLVELKQWSVWFQQKAPKMTF